MTSGELARKCGSTLRTIRFYEEKGILKPSAVSPGGKKSYDLESLFTLQRVRLLKEAGMSLEEIARTLQVLSECKTAGKEKQQSHAALLIEARKKILTRIRLLDDLKASLDNAIENRDNCEACREIDCLGCSTLDTWVRFGFELPPKDDPPSDNT